MVIPSTNELAIERNIISRVAGLVRELPETLHFEEDVKKTALSGEPDSYIFQ